MESAMERNCGGRFLSCSHLGNHLFSQRLRAREGFSMKLILQPEAGIAPLLTAIDRAKKIVHIVIFRFDLDEIQKALERAVERGVRRHGPCGSYEQRGQKRLRKLELRMLKSGVTVSRTEDDLVRSAGSPSDDTPAAERSPAERIADELVAKARQTAASLRFIEDPSLLQPYGGVGAFLRFLV